MLLVLNWSRFEGYEKRSPKSKNNFRTEIRFPLIISKRWERLYLITLFVLTSVLSDQCSFVFIDILHNFSRRSPNLFGGWLWCINVKFWLLSKQDFCDSATAPFIRPPKPVRQERLLLLWLELPDCCRPCCRNFSLGHRAYPQTANLHKFWPIKCWLF